MCQAPCWLTKAEIKILKKKFPRIMTRKNRVQKLMQHAYGNGKHLTPQYKYQLAAILREITVP